MRRLSAGSNMAAAAYQMAETLTRGFLADGRSEAQIAAAMDYGLLNGLMVGARG